MTDRVSPATSIEPMSGGEREQDLVDMDRLVRGQDGALDALMGRHGGRLYAYLVRLLQDEGDAEDLAQETFVRVYEHRGRFRPELGFTNWMYTIAGNLVRDRYRWRSRHPEAPLEGEDGGGPAWVDAGAGAGGSGDCRTPDLAAEASERAEAVRRAVGALPPDLREPLVLAEFEERSHGEIGQILGCSPKAVEMKLYRARQKLKGLLRGWLG